MKDFIVAESGSADWTECAAFMNVAWKKVELLQHLREAEDHLKQARRISYRVPLTVAEKAVKSKYFATAIRNIQVLMEHYR